MKKMNLKFPLNSVLFLLVLVSSCNGQSKTEAQSASVSSNTYNASTELQLDFLNPSTKITHSNALDYSAQVGNVRNIYQDSRGLIWMGTGGNGLALYIGESLNYFTTKDGLGSNQINDLTEDIHGNMWIATSNGVAMYPGGEFTNYTTKDGLRDNAVSSVLADSKGNVWIGTKKGVSKFDGKTFANFELPKPNIEDPTYIVSLDHVWQMIEDKNGNIWFARDGYGATKYDGKNFTHFTKKDGLCGNDVNAITEDKNGNIWFGTIATRVPSKENKFHYIDSKDGGLSMYNGETITQYPNVNGLKENDIHTLYTDKKGHVWIGAKNVGLYKYDGSKFKLYTENEGYTMNNAQSVLEDKDGKMWLGYSGGLFTLSQEKVTHITRRDLGYIDNPYAIKFRIHELDNPKEFELEVRMELDSGAYFVSPVSKERYMGHFRVEIEDRGMVELENKLKETPESIEIIDSFSHEPVNKITQTTTYTQKFTITSKKNFEISGVVKFVIEPKCTMEEIPFLLMYRGGKLQVRKVGMGGC